MIFNILFYIYCDKKTVSESEKLYINYLLLKDCGISLGNVMVVQQPSQKSSIQIHMKHSNWWQIESQVSLHTSSWKS